MLPAPRESCWFGNARPLPGPLGGAQLEAPLFAHLVDDLHLDLLLVGDGLPFLHFLSDCVFLPFLALQKSPVLPLLLSS